MTITDTRRGPVNLRDVGGVRTDDGRSVVRGVLYRSEAPQPGDRQPSEVPVWPPRTVIDLRSRPETGAVHPLAAEDVRIHSIPLGLALAPDAELRRSTIRDLAPLYVQLARDASSQIGRAAAIVADAPAPVLVHCAAGKDRTGIVVAIVLRAAGVRREDVLADYVRTRDRFSLLWPRLQEAGAHLPDDPVLLDVAPHGLSAVLEHVESHPGGAAGWVAAAGGAPDLAERLQRRLLG